ncbi:MAG: class A beta-lactamase [Chthoniobacterales bacterium]
MSRRSMAWAGVLVALLSAPIRGASGKSSPVEARAVEKQIAEIEHRLGGRMGIAALETRSGRRFAHRSEELFPMCSTFKLLAVAAVLHRVDQQREQLDHLIPYAEIELLEYAPVTREHIKEGAMTVRALCVAALQVSDNTAANLLLRTIDGPGGFIRYARSLGDKVTRLDRFEPHLNSAEPGDDRDTTTPAAMLADLRALLLGDALSSSSRQLLDGWLAGNQTGFELIRAGVPNDWKVGDKTGRGAHGATNDIAILRPPGRASILLAIHTVGSTASVKTRLDAIAETARAVVESF